MEVTPENNILEPTAPPPRERRTPTADEEGGASRPSAPGVPQRAKLTSGWRAFFLRPRRISLLLVIVNLLILAAALLHEPRITVSRETTFLVEPLDSEGFVDYLAAVNQQWSRGVTPENNAAVLLAQALDPKEVEESVYHQFYADLQIPEPRPETVFLPEYWRFVSPVWDDDKSERAGRELGQALRRPWNDDEFPVIADWIDKHTAGLDLAVAASRRTRFYAPMYESGNPLLSDRGSSAFSYRFSCALAVRAMRQLDRRKPFEAWSDILALHRLARLLSECPWHSEQCSSITFVAKATDATFALVGSSQFTEALAAKVEQDLNDLPPRTPFRGSYGETTRYNVLEIVQSVFRTGGDELEIEGFNGNAKLWAMHRLIEWDGVLIHVNAWCDRCQSAAEISGPAKRRAAIKLLDEELGRMRADSKDQPLFQFGRDGPGRQTTQRLANHLISTHYYFYGMLDDKADARWAVLRTQLALKHWWFRHANYPQTLAELVPDFLPEVPLDPLSDHDEPLKYVVTSDQIRIYSIGNNQIDEGGLKTELGREDDIVATFPKM